MLMNPRVVPGRTLSPAKLPSNPLQRLHQGQQRWFVMRPLLAELPGRTVPGSP
ncbi:hypothetical protein DPMN_132685 [Dreissena polymorpha]|uniref:Uncharacterized protein n=1 Tax=Dreissena polymorpha TaxID=45954 RepID=A0A9D4FSX8_DREPO|nr:hypothetical protein DPMN_132685 [Dreissena polymorpha]